MPSHLAEVKIVGGNGGTAFKSKEPKEKSEELKMLKKILVWVGKKKVKAIEVHFADDKPMLFGVTENKMKPKEFIFEDGEHMTSLTLWPNEDVTHLGGIKFKTNHSRRFCACMEKKSNKPLVSVDVASGLCTGIKGCLDGRGIVRLGFMFINNIKSIELTDVEYEGLYDVVPNVDVREVKSMTYYNNTKKTQAYRIETSKKISETSSWSVTGRLELMFSLKVKAAIPLIGGTGGHELKLGVEGRYTSQKSEEKMMHYSFPVKVAPGKTADVVITLGEAKVCLEFRGKVKIVCHEGGVVEYKTSGKYRG
ncbi:aerolysin-like protein, partial [Clarias magur]